MRRPISPRSASTRLAISVVISPSRPIAGDFRPAVGRHQLRPAPVEPTMVAFAVAVVAGQRSQILVEALVPEAHFVTEGIAAGHHTATGLGAALPVVHIVLLEGAGRAEGPQAGQPDRLLDLRRGGLVGVNPGPHLGFVGAAGMPDAQCPRAGAQHREVWEDRADDGLYHFEAWAKPRCHLRGDLRLVSQDFRHRRIGDRVGADADHAVAVAGGEHYPVRVRVDPKVAAGPRPYGREMAPLYVVAVAAEVFGGEFPVARHDPFVHAANELDAALATVEERIQVPGHLAEIFAQRRGLRVEGGEEQPLVAVELRHRIEAPALALQFAVIGFLQIRHADQPPVIAIGPAVIGAGEGGGIAELGAAQPVAAMAADIQKGMHLARRVAHNENRVFAHVSGEKIAGLRDLALMAQKEPAARENALQLLLINIRLDEDAATDEAILGIDQPERVGFHRLSPHWFCGVRRGTRSIDPASTVTIVPVMPLALILELRNTYAPARSAG